MTEKQPEVKETLSYDDRRKELTKVQAQGMVNKDKDKVLSTIEYEMKSVFTEDGIKQTYSNLVESKKKSEEKLKRLESSKIKLDEMPEEIKKLKAQLELLSTYQKEEKNKAEYDAIQEELKVIDKGINQIEETIGTRLKL